MTIGEVALISGAVAVPATWRGRRPPVRQLAESMLRGDAGEARNLAQQFLARVGSRVAVFADLVQPAQYEIGDLWYRGHICIDDEHRAAQVLDRLVRMLPPTPSPSPVARGTRCLLSVLPGEQHTVGLSMFALALEDEGWEVELMDHECDPEDLPSLVERTRPRLVGISAGYLPSAHRMAQVVAAIRALSVPVLVGGAAFNRTGDLGRRVGASAHGADPRIGAVLARRLARS
jgi:methanogenic corrinoid protein MtbC1